MSGHLTRPTRRSATSWARETASEDVRRKRQQLLSFLLRHGRIYSGGGHWTLAHRRWLARQSFEHAAQQIVFQEAIDAIEDAARRLRRLDEQSTRLLPVKVQTATVSRSWQARVQSVRLSVLCAQTSTSDASID